MTGFTLMDGVALGVGFAVGTAIGDYLVELFREWIR